jgi:glycosyltransferase involved in cell wall biosynthesis
MSKVALVSHDVQTIDGRAGGVAAFVTHFGRLLREAGEEVTIILTRQETHPVHVDENWRRRYRDWGIGVVELHTSKPRADRWADTWTARLSEQVTPLLSGFDIAYFQDWANVAFHSARVKRYSRAAMPVLVTVLHGPSGWIRVGNRQYPEIPEDLHLDYLERYAARHSDLVISPSRYMLEWARRNGWEFQREPSVLGLPFLDPKRSSDASAPSTVTTLIFFGRLETRKGVSLFVAALRLLIRDNAEALANLTEVVLLGGEQEAGAVERVQHDLSELGVSVRHVGDLDSEAAGEFLAANAGHSLVVVPSPVENFPYAVVEASRIPGLRLLCSSGGGISEIFDGREDAQLFEPYPLGLSEKLAEMLLSAPDQHQFGAYDAEAANARWLEFHRAALAKATAVAPPKTAVASTVDVCIPNFNSSQYLSQLLRGLEQQTVQGFGVIAVDDGSCPADRAVFDILAERYRERGWKFVTQANSFVDAARNRAASLSEASYLLFLDADDFPAPDTIQRMLEAIELSGDDCLVAGGILFEGEESPYDFDAQSISAQPLARYMPLGPDLVCGLIDPNVLGPPTILIRRSVFQAIGGYREVRGAAHEDWELQIRLAMGGYRVDVLPEYLLYFRRREGGLSHTSPDYEAKQRLIDTYADELGKIGLRGLATSLVALLKGRQALEMAVRESRDARTVRLHGLVADMLRRKSQG